MIEIIYYKNLNRVTITGHAHSGEPGKDLVCAGVTTLAYTLATNIANFQKDGLVKNVVIEMEPGEATISCRPVANMRSTVKLIFTAICIGLEQMAVTYPDFVSYDIHM